VNDPAGYPADPAGYTPEPAGYLESPTANGGTPTNGGHPGDPRPGGSLEPRRGAELTPAERAQRKHSRRLLLTVAVPAVLLGLAALIASILADSGTPSPHPLFVPAGYHAVGDGVFSYAVPNSWSKNDAYSDDAGDLETSGTTGWVGDHLTARPTAPAPGEAAPQVFESFGQDRPTPFALGNPVKIQVPRTTVAYRYDITRPGGFSATAIDAWESSSGAELWLIVQGDAHTTTRVISTLNG
jgi:hypothetical protein